MEIAQYIQEGKAVLGIEFGSTRIKAVLIGEQGEPLASGSHNWENRLEDGVWTYHEEDIWNGLADCYRSLAEQVQQKYQVTITKLAAIGFSAMMHGYLAFDAKGDFLVPFRTWRNTMTEEAAEQLTKRFAFNIPQRWSIAHLYQAILNEEPHRSFLILRHWQVMYIGSSQTKKYSAWAMHRECSQSTARRETTIVRCWHSLMR